MAAPKAGGQYEVSGFNRRHAKQWNQQKIRQQKARTERRAFYWIAFIIVILAALLVIAGASFVTDLQNQSRSGAYAAQLHICSDIYGFKEYSDAWTNCMAGVR